MLMQGRINTAIAAVAAGAAITTGICGCAIKPSGLGAGCGRICGQATASAASRQASAPAVAAVKARFTAAINAVASFGSPPAAYRMTVVSAIAMRQPVPRFSATLMSDLTASGTAAIMRYFGPPQAAAERRALARAMALDADAYIINLGSGVTRISFGNVKVEGAAATVSAEVTVWSRAVARQSLTGTWLTDATVRVIGYKATLSHSLGGPWQVAALTATAGAP